MNVGWINTETRLIAMGIDTRLNSHIRLDCKPQFQISLVRQTQRI